MGRLPVQWVALHVQVTQSPERVIHLQERSSGVVTQTAIELFWRGAQINDTTSVVQVSSILGTKDGPAARRDHHACSSGQLINNGCLNVSERSLARLFEVRPDRRAEAPLDHRVGVEERPAEALSEVAPNS